AQNADLGIEIGGIVEIRRAIPVVLEIYDRRIGFINGNTSGGFVDSRAAQRRNGDQCKDQSQGECDHPFPFDEDAEIFPQDRVLGRGGAVEAWLTIKVNYVRGLNLTQ